MPLSDLPNELDMHVATYLDKTNLLSLCLVSKHWLTVAKPPLFVEVELTSRSGLQAKILLLNLLKYPRLAKKIKVINVYLLYWENVWEDQDVLKEEKACSRQEEENPDLWARKVALLDDFWPHSKTIEKVVNSAWPSLVGKEKIFQELKALEPELYPCLAVILGMAVNVEFLQVPIDPNSDPTFDAVLSYHQPNKTDASGEPRPLSKLRKFVRKCRPRLENGSFVNTWAPLPTEVEDITLTNHNINQFEFPIPQSEGYFPRSSVPFYTRLSNIQISPRLRHLELNKIGIDPIHLLHVLSATGYFQELRTLILTKVCDPEQWYNTENVKQLTLGLSTAVPHLEHFELEVWWDRPHPTMAHSSPPDTQTSFGSLKGNTSLGSIHVELGVVIDTSADDAIFNFVSIAETVLPTSVTKIFFKEVKWTFLEDLADSLVHPDDHNAISEFLAHLPQCKKLVFAQCVGSGLSSHAIQVFDTIEDKLRDSGISFRIDWDDEDSMDIDEDDDDDDDLSGPPPRLVYLR
ncbi:hypothetical protein P280DRAFT_539038 [Massarina eburnea CBS 473.64]|uniref:F-box domain-containing protein n=1 Tax=Massarina eburnea CBS 473.64 TaxID=1395130 RepID=A0A6A6S6C4_9PLEO|nr:hypothetical protein P280DRAFT_539038 [Massarina eburnea CBS 473.64]